MGKDKLIPGISFPSFLFDRNQGRTTLASLRRLSIYSFLIKFVTQDVIDNFTVHVVLVFLNIYLGRIQ